MGRLDWVLARQIACPKRVGKGERVLTRGSSRARESESLFERRLGCERNPQVYVRTPNDLCELKRVGARCPGRQTPGNPGKTRKAESSGSWLVVLTRG
jgi:hypothetical protein